MKKLLAVFVIALLSIICSCKGSRPDATSTQQSVGGKTFVDLLGAQLEAINYPSVVMRDGEVVTVRVSAAPVSQVRRALCRMGGWPAGNRIVRFDDTLSRLRQAEGITRLQIVAHNESLEVRLDQQGKCKR